MNDIDSIRRRSDYSDGMHRGGQILARGLLIGMCGVAAAGAVNAGEIYKSIDANGNVVYSDHLDPSLSKSTLVQLEDPGLPPHELHFCWTNCFTLILDNGVYRRIDGTDETWTVETFSPTAVTLHRHDAPVDWNGYSNDVIYSAQVANDRWIGVTVNGKPTSGIDASWGAALNTLPGSNAERDGKTVPNSAASSSASLSTEAPPPPVPEEEQPVLYEDGYLWTPGYWYWRDQRYLWIAGAWVRPPHVGFLWTPAYWALAGGVFVFHPGYWGSTVGFYGGISYGHGYPGTGYTGGRWIGTSFVYNSAANHVDPVVVHHAYAESAPRIRTTTRTELQTKPATVITTQRTVESPHNTIATEKPPAVVKTPAASTAAKFNRVSTPRAPPVKQ